MELKATLHDDEEVPLEGNGTDNALQDMNRIWQKVWQRALEPE
jgi:hypothetical protein